MPPDVKANRATRKSANVPSAVLSEPENMPSVVSFDRTIRKVRMATGDGRVVDCAVCIPCAPVQCLPRVTVQLPSNADQENTVEQSKQRPVCCLPPSVSDCSSRVHRQLLRSHILVPIQDVPRVDSPVQEYVPQYDSSTTTPVAAPVSAPVADPVADPVAAPVSAPVAAPVAAPVSAPVARPIVALVVAPVSVPVARPIAVPVAVPVALPVTVLVSVSAGSITVDWRFLIAVLVAFIIALLF